MITEGSTFESDGIRNAAQLNVFIYAPAALTFRSNRSLKLNNNKSQSVFEISFTLLRHERCYLTLRSAPSLPRLTAFTSDLFCIPWTSCSLGRQDDWAIRSSQNSSAEPPPLFFHSAAPREREGVGGRERCVLILLSFQEKYIPEHSFHVCHIMEEKVSPCRPGRQPAQPSKQLGHVRVA